MANPKPRVRLPRSIAKGDIIEIKTLISHKMESGQRKDKKGNPIPRRIINRFTCTLDGEPVFSADLHPAISANPYFAFFLRADKGGELLLSWLDDNGAVYSATETLEVA